MKLPNESTSSTRTNDEVVQLAEAWSDDEIVDRVKAGDLDSFEVLMRRYNQRLFRVVKGILRDDNEAEDVVQDTYISAYENLAQFKGLAKFSTWLTKIAVFAASTRRRKLSRMRLIDASTLESAAMSSHSSADGPAENASTGELREVLANAVDELPADLRVVFMLRIVERLNTSETAECLDLSSANVKVRLHRARLMLRDNIDRQIGEEVRRIYQFDGSRCDRLVEGTMARLRQL